MARKKSEQKTMVTSIRLTTDDSLKLKKLADAHGMSMSAYITHGAMHAHEPHPKALVIVQDALNLAAEIAKENAPERLAEIEQKEKKVWSLLK